MQICFSLKPKDIVILGWFIGLVLLLSMTVGSYAEFEPRAGMMFGVITLLWTLVAYPVYKWRNK